MRWAPQSRVFFYYDCLLFRFKTLSLHKEWETRDPVMRTLYKLAFRSKLPATTVCLHLVHLQDDSWVSK